MFDSIRTIRDITYRSVDGEALQLDLHLPRPSDHPAPVIAYFHGGGFEIGERTDYEGTRARALAERGIAVATVTYRLAGVAPFPAPLEDARAAVAWLREHGEAHGVSTERIGAMGASAGGYLAAMLGLPGAGMPAAVAASVPLFAPLDLGQMVNGSPLELELFPIETEGSLLGGPYDPARSEHRALNPIQNIRSGAADFLLVTGDRDRVVEAGVSERFHTALGIAGIPSSLLIVGGAGHEDPAIEAPEVLDIIAGFFRSRLLASGS